MSSKLYVTLVFGAVIPDADLKAAGLERHHDESEFQSEGVAISMSSDSNCECRSYLWAIESHKRIADGYGIIEVPFLEFEAIRDLNAEAIMVDALGSFCRAHNLRVPDRFGWMIVSGMW